MRSSAMWLRWGTCALATLGLAGWLLAQGPDSSTLIVHEWGTFTAVAGADGRAVEWGALSGAPDLPEFVEHFSGLNFKVGLRGTIRMETPVMYFYSPQDATVSVHVAFAKGVITEWYPHASGVEPRGALPDLHLSRLPEDGSITWNDVAVTPGAAGAFPPAKQPSRYYAARQTASAPLRVMTAGGEQQEKFLFYRGVSAAALPLTAQAAPDGSLHIQNLGAEEIPAAIYFERRGEKAGFRVAGAVSDEVFVEAPELTGNVDALGDELANDLADLGLYPDEAQAMVATWRDAWFEEGSRLIYIVPRGFIDHVLPLAIDPAPAQVVRVFVGRMEILTPATLQAVQTALAANDQAVLEKYGRFLEPIMARINAAPLAPSAP